MSKKESGEEYKLAGAVGWLQVSHITCFIVKLTDLALTSAPFNSSVESMTSLPFIAAQCSAVWIMETIPLFDNNTH